MKTYELVDNPYGCPACAARLYDYIKFETLDECIIAKGVSWAHDKLSEALDIQLTIVCKMHNSSIQLGD